MNGNLTPAEETLRALAPWLREALLGYLGDMTWYIGSHPDVPVPTHGVLSIDVHGDSPGERCDDVLLTAIALGVSAVDDGEWLSASRTFGTLTIEARTPARKAKAA